MDNNTQPTQASGLEQPAQPQPIQQPPVSESLSSTPNPFSAFPPNVSDMPPVTPPLDPFVKPKKSKKKLVIIIIVVLVLLAAAAAAWYLFLMPKAPPKPVVKAAVTTAKTTSAPTSTQWLTYAAVDNSKLLVTDSQQKTIATVALPKGESSFDVVANNNQNVLIEAQSSSAAVAPQFIQVGTNGKEVQISSSLANTLTNLDLSNATFTTDGNLLYTSCDKTSCSLMSLNLSTGVTSTITSVAYVPPTSSTIVPGSLVLLGASSKNIAYFVQGQVSQTLVSFDTATKKPVTTVALPFPLDGTNLPVLSPDDSLIIYDNDVSNGKTTATTIEIMNTMTGRVTSIAGDSMHPSVSTASPTPIYVWSPDSTKAAFAAGESADVAPVNTAVAYVDLASDKVVTSKDFGPSTLNQMVFIGGWSSATQLNYTYETSSTGNYSADGKATDYAVNVTTKAITTTQAPTLAGYRMVTINSEI